MEGDGKVKERAHGVRTAAGTRSDENVSPKRFGCRLIHGEELPGRRWRSPSLIQQPKKVQFHLPYWLDENESCVSWFRFAF